MIEKKDQSDSELNRLMGNFKKALAQLEFLISENDTTDKGRDAAIHRFEIVFELGWKTVQKALAEIELIKIGSPKQAFSNAYAVNWIQNEEVWVDMLRARNLTSHTYDEEMAKEVLEKIRIFLPYLKELLAFLEKKMES